MNQFAPCPKCQNTAAEQLKSTWWGGVIGPKLFTHVKCQSCGAKYNGKTGKDNTANILIYSVGGMILVGIISAIVAFVVTVFFLKH